VIVGGGHNGLIAAAYLAHAGQSVLLLERNEDLGGAISSKAIFSGMDARLSRYAYLVSLLPQTIIKDLGLRFTCRRRAIASCTPYERDGIPQALLLSNVDENYARLWMKRASDTQRRPEGTRGPHSLLSNVNENDSLARLLELQRALAARIWPSLLQPLRTRQEWRASLATPDERGAWDAFVERPLGEAIERYLQDDLVRGLVFTDAKVGLFTHPHDQTLLQNRCFILHVIGQGTGEWQVPVGGMGALVEELSSVAGRAGAQLVTRAPVEAIRPGHPYHTVVFQRGDEPQPDSNRREHAVEARRVLVNAGPQVFARLLGTSYVPAAGDEGSVCKVNMLLRRLPRLKAGVDPSQAFAGTFHVDESYEQMQISYRQATACQVPGRPPAEIYCHTLTDDSILGPDLRTAGYHTLTLFGLDMPYRVFEADNEGVKAEVLSRYFRGLNDVLAEPIEECLARDANGELCVEIKSPLDLERELALNRGNIFHDAPSWFFVEDTDQAGTWGVETEYERIYRCGSSALRGGAVSGIPGYSAVRRIFEELRVS
jgi:phytoene dehydrogenase-like protein